MATVTTPSGERLEGVTGDLLAYYLNEAETVPGYGFDVPDEAVVSLPRMWDGEQYVGLAEPVEDVPETPSGDVPEPLPDLPDPGQDATPIES